MADTADILLHKYIKFAISTKEKVTEPERPFQMQHIQRL